MNIYITLILLSVLVYILTGFYAGKRVADTADYYVSGRNANTLLITGTLHASMEETLRMK